MGKRAVIIQEDLKIGLKKFAIKHGVSAGDIVNVMIELLLQDYWNQFTSVTIKRATNLKYDRIEKKVKKIRDGYDVSAV